eukprot:g1912.t2
MTTIEHLHHVHRSSAEVEDKVANALEAFPSRPEVKQPESRYGLAVHDTAARTGANGWVVPIRAWIYRRNDRRHRIRMALARKIMMEMIHGIKNISKEGVRRYEARLPDGRWLAGCAVLCLDEFQHTLRDEDWRRHIDSSLVRKGEVEFLRSLTPAQRLLTMCHMTADLCKSQLKEEDLMLMLTRIMHFKQCQQELLDLVQGSQERGRLIFRSLAFRGGERNVVLSVKFDGEDEWRDLPPTNGNGRVEVDVTVPEHLVEKAAEDGLLNLTVRLPGEDITARASALLVQPEGVLVISDIDDTVKVTEVFLGKESGQEEVELMWSEVEW